MRSKPRFLNRRSYRKKKVSVCKQRLQKKISILLKEYKSGKKLSNGRRITSPKMAVAIAYQMAKKEYPHCKF